MLIDPSGMMDFPVMLGWWVGSEEVHTETTDGDSKQDVELNDESLNYFYLHPEAYYNTRTEVPVKTGNPSISDIPADATLTTGSAIINHFAFPNDLELAQPSIKPGYYTDYFVSDNYEVMPVIKFEAPDVGKKGIINGASKIPNIAKKVMKWLGEDAIGRTNKAEDIYFLSQDKLRKMRFDFNKTYPHINKHIHLEYKLNGKWIKSGPIYPKNVPHK